MHLATTLALASLGASSTFASPSLPGLQQHSKLEVMPTALTSHGNHLYISTFRNSDSSKVLDGVIRVPLRKGALKPKESERMNTVVWPNKVEFAPGGALGSEADTFVTPGGFILQRNGMYLTFPDKGFSFRVSPDDGDYHYTEAQWFDVDGDGLYDLVAQRSTYTVPFTFDGESQVVWFKNNGQSPDTTAQQDLQAWDVHVIDSGKGAGDTHFVISDLDGDGIEEIIGCQHFNNKGWFGSANAPSLNVLSVKQRDGFATGTVATTVSKTELAENLNGVFHVEAVDMNNDGKVDLLVNNYGEDAHAGVIAVYETPANGDLADASAWTEHILHKGFTDDFGGDRARSPGISKAFFPRHSQRDGKPWIIVSGDGDPRVYLLTPVSQDAGNWQYTMVVVLDTTTQASVPSHVYGIDIDETSDPDCTLLHVPAYEEAAVYTFNACKMSESLESFPLASSVLPRTGSESESVAPSNDVNYPLIVGVVGAVAGVGVVGAVATHRYKKRSVTPKLVVSTNPASEENL